VNFHELLQSLPNWLVFAFVVVNMLALGMELTLREVVKPLRDIPYAAVALFAVVHYADIAASFGAHAILAAIILVAAAAVFGYALGGPSQLHRGDLAVNTAWRGVSAGLAARDDSDAQSVRSFARASPCDRIGDHIADRDCEHRRSDHFRLACTRAASPFAWICRSGGLGGDGPNRHDRRATRRALGSSAQQDVAHSSPDDNAFCDCHRDGDQGLP